MKTFTRKFKTQVLLIFSFFFLTGLTFIQAQDQDGDGISQLDDLDDDNDGVLDVVEGFGYNIYTSNCIGEGSVYVFNSHVLESGTDLDVGAIYRFHNVAAGKDALITIVSLKNVKMTDIDDDTAGFGLVDAFQPRLTFLGVIGIPAAEFKIEIVNSGMSTPLFIESIGGIMLDVDGLSSSNIRESYIVKNVSGYAVSDPTNIFTTDLGGGLIQFEADGTANAPSIGFDPNLKVFFQNRFVNSMSITFQAIKSDTNEKSRMMSFYANECAFQDLKEPEVTITDLINFDGDGLADYLDRDSDNDGIPDLVEAGGVDINGDGVVDNNTDANNNGYYDTYDLFSTGATILDADTDGDGQKNRLDLDSDGDGITDLMESKREDSDQNGIIDSYIDIDSDGYSDNVDGDVGNDNIAENILNSTVVTGADTNSDGIPNTYPNANRDGIGEPNFLDLDADDDGIVDNTEAQLSAGYIAPSGLDTDRDGIDNSYDSIVGVGGSGAFPVNNDGSGYRDFLDLNSDYDSEIDAIEAHDTNGDGVVNATDSPLANTGLFIGVDADKDGIDDGFDNDTSSFNPTNNGLTPLSHPNFDGITSERDWREINPKSSTIDFDGIDDYLHRSTFISNWSGATLMAWVKLDPTFSNTGFVAGQRMFNIEITNSREVKVNVHINNSMLYSVQTSAINTNLWCHVTAVFSGADSTLKVYLNGNYVSQVSVPSSSVLSNDANNILGGFSVGKYPGSNTSYYKGSIDEVRVFSGALPNSQIYQMIYQEIKLVGGNVRGVVIDKDIVDDSSSSKIVSAKLEAYYPMTDMVANRSTDLSMYNRDIALHNIETIQDQTAPMPYETKAGGDGNWTNSNNWLHGNVWDITGAHSDCAIIKIGHDISTNVDHNMVGLIVDSGAELDVRNNSGIINSWYLKLDGKIDLNGESQLVQTEFSDLDVTSSGLIEIEQQGKPDVYSYNFWSAPVSLQGVSLNNSAYSISDVLRDATNPSSLQTVNYTSSSYNGSAGATITLADYWMFKYVNQPDDYANWIQIRSTGTLQVGEGYTQKGPGSAGSFQNYAFVGKPNNGRKSDSNSLTGNDSVKLTIDGGNVYLVGNPFPSAIDSHKFIDDNMASIEENGDVVGSGTTTGALYFWDHWGGGSHILAAYQGGYATLNKIGATYAIPDPGVSNVNTSDTNKALPGRYIPVGQGFFVEADSDGGTIEFNNSQRVFHREMDGNSTFISTQLSDNSRVGGEVIERNDSETEDVINRINFYFTTPTGNKRHLLLGVKEGLTEMIDYGYDAELIDTNHPSDCSFKVEDSPMVIQGIGSIYDQLELPLNIKIGEEGVHTFYLENLADIADDINVYFLDKVTNEITQLETGVEVSLQLDMAEYSDRFYIVFEREVLTIEEETTIQDNLSVFYQTNTNEIVITNQKTFETTNVSIYNMLGQRVYLDTKNYKNVNEVRINNSFATGAYLVRFKYNDQQLVTKKIIVK